MNSRLFALLLSGLFAAGFAGCSSAPKPPPLPDLDINEPTRLIEEAARGNEANVKAMLVAGEKPDQANTQGVTAMMVAARKGQLAVMQLLISAHANLAAVDEQGSTAIHYAVLGNQTKAVELLIQNHSPLDVKDGFDLTPLMLATRFGDLATIKALLQGHASLSAVDENGWTPLFFAVARGDDDIFAAVGKATGKYHDQDNDGDGLVAISVQYKQHELLQKLIDLKAPCDAMNKRKVTPLHIAIENGDLEAVRILTKAVPANEKFSDGRTPMMVAIDLKQQEIARLLLSLKPDSKAKDAHGRTYMEHLTALGLDSDWLDAQIH